MVKLIIKKIGHNKLCPYILLLKPAVNEDDAHDASYAPTAFKDNFR
jgi:hypothetical protein